VSSGPEPVSVSSRDHRRTVQVETGTLPLRRLHEVGAIREQTGWPLAAVDERTHFGVEMPDGRFLDAAGPHGDYEPSAMTRPSSKSATAAASRTMRLAPTPHSCYSRSESTQSLRSQARSLGEQESNRRRRGPPSTVFSSPVPRPQPSVSQNKPLPSVQVSAGSGRRDGRSWRGPPETGCRET
jgi:hypothetical protein